MRYLTPLIFFAAAAFVWNYNATHEGSYVLFPFLDLVPALTGDFDAQAEWSWRLFAGLGGLVLLWTIFRDLTKKKKPAPKAIVVDDEEEEP